MQAHPNYEILEEIGRGEAATVYRAYDSQLKRFVAIKEVRDKLRRDPRQMEHFWEEAQFLANLEHDNVVKVYGIDKERGWIIMELMRGSLDTKLTEGSLPHDLVRSVLQQTLEGLSFLHQKGKLHGAVKPANLLINDEGRLRLSDSAGISTGGQVRKPTGSHKYLAPELLNPAFGQVSPAVDLYGAGFTALELLQGKKFDDLFPGAGKGAIDPELGWMRWHSSTTERLPLAELMSGLPQDLSQVISKLLEKEVAQRYRSAEEALHDLKNLPLLPVELPGEKKPVKEEHGGKPPPGPPKRDRDATPAPKPGDGPKQWTKEWINKKLGDKRILAAVCAALLVPVLIFVFWPRTPELFAVSVETNPVGAKLIDNGKERKDPTNQVYGMTAGKHKLRLVMPGYRVKEAEIDVKASKDTQKHAFDLERDTRKVAISSKPKGASLFVNDEDTGHKTEAELKLAPGKYTIRLTLPGFKSREEQIEVKDDQIFEFTLKKGIPDDMARSRPVQIKSIPSGAELFLDAEPQGMTDAKLNLTIGQKFRLRLKKAGYADFTSEFAVPPGDDVYNLQFSLSKASARRFALLLSDAGTTFADSDVEALSQVLIRAGYQPGDTTISKKTVNAENSREKLRYMVTDKSAADTLLVVLTGREALPLGEVYSELAACPAQAKLVVVDAAEGTDVPPPGVAVLFARGKGQQRYLHLDWRHSVFFHAVIQGLSGLADSDGNGQTTATELQGFVAGKVTEYMRKEYPKQPGQTPRMVGTLPGAVAMVPSGSVLQQHGSGLRKLQAGNMQGAVDDFTQVLSRDSKFAPALRQRAIAYFGQDQHAKTMQDCTAAIALNGQDAEAYAIRGEAAFEGKLDQGKALADLSQAIKLAPDWSTPYQTRARLYRSQKNLAGALADLDTAIKLAPLNPNYWEERGVTHAAGDAKSYRLAEQDYLKALELKPGWDLPYRDLSKLYDRQGDADKAKTWAEKANKVKAGMTP